MTYRVPLTTITSITPIPNAERLEIARVYGWDIVVQKNRYQVGSVVVLIPIDSIIPQWLEDKVFPPNGKVKLHRHRVRQIRLRGQVSQGLLIDPADVAEGIASWAEANKKKKVDLELEQDLAEMIGVTKYEPEVHDNTPKAAIKRNKPLENPYFRKYNGITNIKWNPNAFVGQDVVIQDKYHGSHIRFGRAPFVANTFWKKVKKFLGLTPKFESVYGSNNVELTNRPGNKGFYGMNVYGTAIEKEGAFEFIEDGAFVHAELIGPGLQKNYTYGLTEHHIIVFDVRLMQEDGTQKWLDPEDAEKWADERGFDFAEVLYKGPFDKDVLEKLTVGRCSLGNEVREGVVVKARYHYDNQGDKVGFKSISPEYLADTSNSDEH